MRAEAAEWFKSIWSKIGLDREWYLVIVAMFIGSVVAGVAMAFILPLHWMGERVGTLHADHPEVLVFLVPFVPVLGALLCGVIHWLIPGGEGDGPGVTKVMFATYRRQSRLPLTMAARKWLASTATIASGGSAGAEGPIVTIGAVAGSTIGRVLGANPQNKATLLGCGAAAGIASVFNAPIAGVFFVMEIMLRDFSLRTFTPIVIASVVSAAVTHAVLGNDPLFPGSQDFTVEAFSLLEIPNYVVLGVICGITAAVFIRSLYSVMRSFRALPLHPVLQPVSGALVLGGLGLAYLLVSHEVPKFYGNGYEVIAELLSIDHYYTDATHSQLAPARMLLIGLVALAFLKGIATCLTIGSGGAGGMFAPSLLIGASVGGVFGYIVNVLGWFPAASPAHYALVGMAAMIAATTHAPLTAILIVYEITQRYEVILPLMLAAVIATVIGRLVSRESIYTVKLAELGVRVGAMSDLTILRRLTVQDVPLVAPVFVHPDESAQRLLELAEKLSISDFVVTDRRSKYLGLVTGGDLKEALVFREAIPLLQVNELQRDDLPVVSNEETLDVVLDKFAAHDVQALAVVDGGNRSAILGLVTRSRLMARYQRALGEG